MTKTAFAQISPDESKPVIAATVDDSEPCLVDLLNIESYAREIADEPNGRTVKRCVKEILDITVFFEGRDETMTKVADLAREIIEAVIERRVVAANEIIELVNQRLPDPAAH